MPLINPDLNSALAHLTLCGVIGFMYHTNLAFEEINQNLESLASTTFSELLKLKQCMKNIQIECTNCNLEIKDMKDALVHAKRTQNFADIEVGEMEEVCQTLLDVFKVLFDTNKTVHAQRKSFYNSLSKTEERFKTEHARYTWKYGGMGAVVGGILTGTTLGTLVGVCSTYLGTHCTSYSKSRTEIILRKLFADAGKINYTACDSVFTMIEVVNCLQTQLKSAEKNNRTKAETGFGVKKRADNMIADICELKDALDAMKEMAEENECYIKNIMDCENVVDLLEL
ncbi:hypothetical protein HPULCUR_007812 [Helicostylum pulchrum]|uniref:Uncharacterized protein n=1 Tax=Helicostylum pulchrum TaxID=562976 RepID=A0ABP9Y5T8_9FUNG